MGYILVFAAGLVAGFINVNAGGGSLITLPALIFIGIPPVTANGTNRIAILAGAVSAIINFHRKNALELRLAAELSLPTVTGAIAGTLFAVRISDALFQVILSAVMIFVVSIIFIRPALLKKKREDSMEPAPKVLIGILFIIVGFYGGFIQAGVGILSIAVLSICTGYSLVRINAVKVFLIAVYTVFSLAIFFLNGKIDLWSGLVLAAGNAVGSYAGSSLAIRKGDIIPKALLVIAVAAMAARVAGLL